MTGDVLPCFDASLVTLPMDTSCIITVPITLDVAANHGVIVAAETEHSTQNYAVSLVDNLLQKPSVEELVKSKAILTDGRTLLDTGIITVRGKAWLELVTLASSCQQMISELLKSKKEVYEVVCLVLEVEKKTVESNVRDKFIYLTKILRDFFCALQFFFAL